MTRGLGAYVARRLAVAIAFVMVVSAASLLLVRMAPGDATLELGLSGASEEAIAAARDRLGLDQPAIVQLGRWITGLVTLDLGTSSRFGRPVADLVASRMVNTAWLGILALAIAVALGLPAGILTGTKPRSLAAGVATGLSLFLVCCPPIIGTLALLFLAASTGWMSVVPGAMAIPVIALALPLAAVLERLQSQAVSEAMSSPDILAAAARGVPRRRLIWFHIGRQALRPVLGVSGIVVATLFSGSVAVETITGWPGLGRLTLDALGARDVYLTTGCALAGAVLVAMGNLVADLLRFAADPRLRPS